MESFGQEWTVQELDILDWKVLALNEWIVLGRSGGSFLGVEASGFPGVK